MEKNIFNSTDLPFDEIYEATADGEDCYCTFKVFQLNDKFGLSNSNNKILIPAIMDAPPIFKEVRKNGFIITKSGTTYGLYLVIRKKPIGFGEIYEKSQLKLINASGDCIESIFSLRYRDSIFILVKRVGLLGIVDKDYKVLIPVEYNNIKILSLVGWEDDPWNPSGRRASENLHWAYAGIFACKRGSYNWDIIAINTDFDTATLKVVATEVFRCGKFILVIYDTYRFFFEVYELKAEYYPFTSFVDIEEIYQLKAPFEFTCIITKVKQKNGKRLLSIYGNRGDFVDTYTNKQLEFEQVILYKSEVLSTLIFKTIKGDEKMLLSVNGTCLMKSSSTNPDYIEKYLKSRVNKWQIIDSGKLEKEDCGSIRLSLEI